MIWALENTINSDWTLTTQRDAPIKKRWTRPMRTSPPQVVASPAAAYGWAGTVLKLGGLTVTDSAPHGLTDSELLPSPEYSAVQ